MKELNTYSCEYCGSVFTTLDEAEQCEASHATGLSIVGTEYKPNSQVNNLNKYLQLELDSFPVSITIMDSRGIKAIYSVTRQQLEDTGHLFDEKGREFIDSNRENL